MSRWPRRAAIALLFLALPALARAQSVADFYKGRHITFVVGSESSGDYDVWVRLLIRFMGKYLPGNPGFVVQNMPGAGGIRATNYMNNVAPKDGSVIAMTSRNTAFKAFAGEPGIQFDPRKFNWIGSPEVTSRVCVVSRTSPVQTLAEAFEKEAIMAGAGAGTALSTVPPMLNRLFGTKFRLVEGYSSATAAKLAIDRGEVHGLCQSLSQITRAYMQDIEAGRLKILLSMERSPPPGFPDVPSIHAYAKSEQLRAVLDLFSMGTQMGRPIHAPAGVPADRVAALREAFRLTMADEELRAEAKRANFESTYVSGESIGEMVNRLFETPQNIRDLAGNIGD